MAPPMQSTADDRRLHPRRAVRHPVELETADGLSIRCESVDVSVGGMKVRSASRIPLGPADVVISAEGDAVLALRGEVVEELLDVSTGEIFARIVFEPAPPAALERVAALPDGVVGAGSGRRRTITVLAASIVAGIVVAGGVFVATRDGDDVAVGRTVPAASTAAPTTTIAEPAPVDAPPRVANPAPTVSDAPVPAPVDSPAPVTRPTPEPAATAPAEPAPAAPVTRVDRTDDLTRVVLGSSAEDTSVQTTTRPSPEGDEVKMQLTVTPEPDGTTLPVAVRIENRGAETITFPDGLEVTVTAFRDGAAAAATTLTSGITELAPGASVTVEGLLDFGETGEFTVAASTELSEP